MIADKARTSLYCRSILPRAGLGNRLFPWARCVLFAYLHGARMLAPHWTQLKPGPLLRGERDLRIYHNLFHRRQGELIGLAGLWLTLRATQVAEPPLLSAPLQSTCPHPHLVTFSGEGDHFTQLNGQEQLLARELHTITNAQWLKAAHCVETVPIAIHVRRGDFREPATSDEFRTSGALRTPIWWFEQALKIIRQAAGFSTPAYIVSDGSEDELQPLLGFEPVRLIRTGSAISDLLFLSRARVLIASGGSSFSAWAAFLGQMPTITHPGQPLTWFGLRPGKSQFIGEFDPSNPPARFLEQAQASLTVGGSSHPIN